MKKCFLIFLSIATLTTNVFAEYKQLQNDLPKSDDPCHELQIEHLIDHYRILANLKMEEAVTITGDVTEWISSQSDAFHNFAQCKEEHPNFNAERNALSKAWGEIIEKSQIENAQKMDARADQLESDQFSMGHMLFKSMQEQAKILLNYLKIE